MKGVDILASFELEINKLSEALEKPVTDDSLYWINQAVVKFVKDRFNGNAPKRTSYELNEKRTRDLVRLLREVAVITYDPTPSSSSSSSEGSSSDGSHGGGYGNDYLLESLVHHPENREFMDIDPNEYAQWYEVYSGDTSKEYVRLYDVYGEYTSPTSSYTTYETSGSAPVGGSKTEGSSVSEQVGNTAYSNQIESYDNIQLSVKTTHPSYDSYEYKYPKNMMFMLNEDVVISNMDGEYLMDTCVFECTADSFMYRINNKLTDFHYRFHRARPLRIRTRDGFRLLTDKKYKIKAYTLGYLKVPTEITSEDPYKDYTDFDDHIWLEITKIAAQMYIENQSDPRYKTITNEVLTQE